MTNQELILLFEADRVPAGSFHHADHVRMAFAYLTEYPVLEGLEKFSATLQARAVARCRPELYHATITFAYYFLIRERMAGSASDSWEEFAARNPDLLSWKDGILSRYYNEKTLQSDLARGVFVLPDRLR